jgi:hypothetical protein
LFPSHDQASAATINQLREAFAIQKWLELNARTVNKYFETSAQVKQFLIELGMNESAYTQFLLQ